MTEQEAEKFISSLTTHTPDSSFISEISKVDDDYIVSKNNEIIKKVDDMLIERLDAGDMSLTTKDMIAMKTESFKQVRIIEGHNDDTKQLIPITVNLQVINN